MVDIEKEICEYLAGVTAAVSVTEFEYLTLWETYADDEEDWASEAAGYNVAVGQIGGSPVSISLAVVTIRRQRILFYSSISDVMDKRLVNEWLTRMLPQSAWRAGEVNKIDALNFSDIFTAD